MEHMMTYLKAIPPEIIGLISLSIIALMIASIIISHKVSLGGNLHLWLDRHFLGFLKKSNEAILRSLLMVLKPAERLHAEKLDKEKQNTLVQSIFAFLSNDAQIFDILLTKKIFRVWTLYWVVVYATLIFLLLTIASFVTVAASIDTYAKMLFLVFWVLTFFHLFLAVTLGNILVSMSRKVVDAIVYSNKQQIVFLLREKLHQHEALETES